MSTVTLYSKNKNLIRLFESFKNINVKNYPNICLCDCDYEDKTKLFLPCIAVVYSETDILPHTYTYVLLYPFTEETFFRTVKRIFLQPQLPHTYMQVNIKALFAELGIANNRKGTQYLTDAVYLKINSKNGEISIKRIISKIANKYSVTENSVERNMRTAIENACEYGNSDKIYELFGSTINSEKGKPTNSQFISVIAEKCKYNDYTKIT